MAEAPRCGRQTVDARLCEPLGDTGSLSNEDRKSLGRAPAKCTHIRTSRGKCRRSPIAAGESEPAVRKNCDRTAESIASFRMILDRVGAEVPLLQVRRHRSRGFSSIVWRVAKHSRGVQPKRRIPGRRAASSPPAHRDRCCRSGGLCGARVVPDKIPSVFFAAG